MQCPDCGGAMWDNRSKKASGEFKPTSPDHACKDKANCGKGVWLEAFDTAPEQNGPPPNEWAADATESAPQPAIQRNGNGMSALYRQSLEDARVAVRSYVADHGSPPSELEQRVATTIFINRTG